MLNRVTVSTMTAVARFLSCDEYNLERRRGERFSVDSLLQIPECSHERLSDR
jgi:hypothetical protein